MAESRQELERQQASYARLSAERESLQQERTRIQAQLDELRTSTGTDLRALRLDKLNLSRNLDLIKS